MSDVLHHRGRLAALTRSRSIDDPDLVKARRDLKAARLEDYIKKTVDAAPPLSREQLDRLGVLLRGGEPPGDRVARTSPLATQTGGRSQKDRSADYLSPRPIPNVESA